MEVTEEINIIENSRFILGLRNAGWTEKQINDFMLYIESGQEQYMPQPMEKEKTVEQGLAERAGLATAQSLTCILPLIGSDAKQKRKKWVDRQTAQRRIIIESE